MRRHLSRLRGGGSRRRRRDECPRSVSTHTGARKTRRPPEGGSSCGPEWTTFKLVTGGQEWLCSALPQARALDGADSTRPDRQRQVRLSEQRQRELVERYRAGATQRELAEMYGIERRTAMEIIRRHEGTAARGLASAQVDEAGERYCGGASLATVAEALGVAANTVRRRLLERGVVMRSVAGQADDKLSSASSAPASSDASPFALLKRGATFSVTNFLMFGAAL